MRFKVSEDGVGREFQSMESLVEYLTRQRSLGLAMVNRAINRAMGGKVSNLSVYTKTLTVERI